MHSPSLYHSDYSGSEHPYNPAPSCLTPPETPHCSYDMTVVADGYVQSPDGLIYRDFVEGSGECPVDGQVRLAGRTPFSSYPAADGSAAAFASSS